MDSSVPIEGTMQREHAQKIQEQGNHEFGSLVRPTQKETKLSKQTPLVALVEQQETHDELVAQVESPFASAGKVINRHSEPVLCAELPSKTDREGSMLAPTSVNLRKEHSQVPLTVEHSLGSLDIEEAHMFSTQHTPLLLNVGKDFDNTTVVETSSERLILPSPQQSGLIEQYVAHCVIDVPVSSVEELRTEPSMSSPQQTLKVRSESTSEQLFAKHLPTLTTESGNSEALHSY